MDKDTREIIYKLYHHDKKFSNSFLGALFTGQTWFIYNVGSKATRLEVAQVSKILTEFEEVNSD